MNKKTKLLLHMCCLRGILIQISFDEYNVSFHLLKVLKKKLYFGEYFHLPRNIYSISIFICVSDTFSNSQNCTL